MCWAYGIGNAAVMVAGGAVMVLGGPVGMLAGGVILGAGISGEVGTIQQAVNKEQEEFNQKQVLLQTGIGAAGGLVAAPFAIGGGIAASAISSTAGKIGVQVAASALGGSASGGVSQVISNA
jgi:hypothetical protein